MKYICGQFIGRLGEYHQQGPMAEMLDDRKFLLFCGMNMASIRVWRSGGFAAVLFWRQQTWRGYRLSAVFDLRERRREPLTTRAEPVASEKAGQVDTLWPVFGIPQSREGRPCDNGLVRPALH